MFRARRAKLYGFTLVELLIVVAIIGVLATIGVPTFRTMVQKAKKSEAKVALGGLYTAETAFFAEYGSYGSHLDRIGFDLEGQDVNRVYAVGFMDASCAAAGTAPASTNAVGSALNLAFPGYYTGTPTIVYKSSKAPSSGCLAGTVNATGSDFLAVANGIIAPGSSGVVPDQWSMNRSRALTNVQDGVSK